MTNHFVCGIIIGVEDIGASPSGKATDSDSVITGVRIPVPQPTKNALLSTKTKVRFLNDVCLRQMMTASPNDVRFANDAWLRHIWGQTSPHCGTQWSNIILSEAKNIISPQGNASLRYKRLRLDLFAEVWYNMRESGVLL